MAKYFLIKISKMLQISKVALDSKFVTRQALNPERQNHWSGILQLNRIRHNNQEKSGFVSSEKFKIFNFGKFKKQSYESTV